MPTSTGRSPSAEVIERLASRLAKLLIETGLTVSIDANGLIEVENPGNGRMTQPITVIDRDGELWWAWLWSGPTRDAPYEVEPMVATTDLDEAARRVANVLRVDVPEQAR